MRDEVYNWGSFPQSRMFAQGVTCSDCHDPHSLKLQGARQRGVRAMPPAGEVRQPGAHASRGRARPARRARLPHADHDLHGRRSAPRPFAAHSASRPVGEARRAERLQRLPREADAAVGGRAIVKWTGKCRSGYQNFAEALHAGSTGAPGARGALLALIDDKAQPAIVRASAIARLGRWMTPATLPARVARAERSRPARCASRRSRRWRTPMRRRASATCRACSAIRCARCASKRRARSRGRPKPDSRPSDRTRFDRALAEYVAAQRTTPIGPKDAASLANLYAARGNAEGAIAEYRKAIEIDPTYVQAYANLADLYRARGVDSEAEAVLRAGIAQDARRGGAASRAGPRARAAEAHRRRAEGTGARRVAARSGQRALCVRVCGGAERCGPAQAGVEVLDDGVDAQPVRSRCACRRLRTFRARAGDRETALKYVTAVARARPGKYRIRAIGEADRGRSAAPVTRLEHRNCMRFPYLIVSGTPL